MEGITRSMKCATAKAVNPSDDEGWSARLRPLGSSGVGMCDPDSDGVR
jgi:hypothetical protein